jgi:hypothetical protein
MSQEIDILRSQLFEKAGAETQLSQAQVEQHAQAHKNNLTI